MADINNNTLNFIDQYEAQKTGSAFFTKHFKNIEKKMILGLFVKAAKKLYIQANYPQKLREQVNKATNEFITFSEQLLLKKSPTSVFSFSSFKEQLLDMNSANSIIEAMNTGIKSEFEVFKRLASDPNHGETTFERDTKVGQPFSIEESDREGTKKTYRLFPELNTLEKDKRIEKAKELVSSFITEQNKKWENTLQVLATQVAINPVEVAIGNWLTVNLHTNTSLIHTPLNADNYPEGTSLTNNNPAPELKIVRDTEGNITEVKVNIPMQYSLYNKQPDGEGVLIEDFMKANASFTVTLDDQNMPVISDFSYEIKSSNEYPGVDISLKSEDKN